MEEVDVELEIYILLKKKAELGDPNDLYLFALYLHVNERKFDEAYIYYELAAQKGHVFSKVRLFQLNIPPNDTVSSPNKSVALEWLTQAANENCIGAQHMLGTIYFDGEVVSKCLTTSFKWFLKASSNGHHGSQIKLSKMYELGSGVQKNTTSGKFWRRKALKNTNKDGRFEEEKVKVWDILKERASHGQAEDLFAAGLYLEERGGSDCWPEASRYYKLSADQGHMKSQVKIAIANMYGYTNANGESNLQLANKYAEMAANQGHVECQMIMAGFFFKGFFVEQCFSTAFIWFEKAANKNFANAQNMLGKMYNEGLGVDKNELKSFEWFELAKANGYDPKKDEHSPLYEDSYSDKKDNQHFLPLSCKKKEKQNFQKGECSNCGKSDNLKSCARCQLVQYCNTACQKQHWNAIGGHKKFCVSKEERKRVLTSPDYLTHADSTHICSICIEEILKGSTCDIVVSHSCKHEFHIKCFALLCESGSNNRCPVCRVDINIIHVFENGIKRVLGKDTP